MKFHDLLYLVSVLLDNAFQLNNKQLVLISQLVFLDSPISPFWIAFSSYPAATVGEQLQLEQKFAHFLST